MTICAHVKSNGETCGSPAQGQEQYCYHHLRWHRARNAAGDSGYSCPVLDDRDSIQILINDTIRGLIRGTIEPRVGSTILYAAQVSLANFKQQETLAEKATKRKSDSEPRSKAESKSAEPEEENFLARLLTDKYNEMTGQKPAESSR